MANVRKLAMVMAAAAMMGTMMTAAAYGSESGAAYAETKDTIVLVSPELPSVEELGDGAFRRYTLTLFDEINANLEEEVVYPYGMTSINIYEGSYNFSDNGDSIIFNYENEANTTRYNIFVADNMIQNVDVFYGASPYLKEVAGTYYGSDDIHGSMELTIDELGVGTLHCENGMNCSGSVYNYNGNWDFAGYDENNGEYIDWILQLGGGEFTYVSYMEYCYGAYEGSYQAEGDLGVITFDVDAEGNAIAEVPLFGQMIRMEGNILADTETRELTGLSAWSEEGYAISLELKWLEDDGILNYNGYYTVPLGAG